MQAWLPGSAHLVEVIWLPILNNLQRLGLQRLLKLLLAQQALLLLQVLLAIRLALLLLLLLLIVLLSCLLLAGLLWLLGLQRVGLERLQPQLRCLL
ncbi:hypothetical protein COO60DRAFT_1560077 [Scenedesmus sp. NREL 46B-D3]|nr:hypothetical protein COO60DRAFT_1560077 [Scenedesmus sp. NREL 46B-D3]